MTAIEWLIEQLFELRNPTLNQIEIMKQAKQIEKEQGYSEEDLKESWYNGMKSDNGFFGSFEEWFEQFKKK